MRGAYGVSFAYILGDVSYEGYKASRHNRRVLQSQLELTPRQQKITERAEATLTGRPVVAPALEDTVAVIKPGKITALEDYRTVLLQRALFQSIASIGLPAFTIHNIVRYSGRAMKNFKHKTVKMWAPIGLGLSVVPFMPSLFDKPVENAVEWVFYQGFAAYGGKEAVGDWPGEAAEWEAETEGERVVGTMDGLDFFMLGIISERTRKFDAKPYILYP